MPSRRAVLEPADVFSYARQQLRPSDRDLIGIEAEWLTYDRATGRRPTFESLHEVATTTLLPRGGKITIEPGGQIELSSLPLGNVDAACDCFEEDAAALFEVLAAKDIEVEALGRDPSRGPQRVVSSPRYNAMESYFDSIGSAGRVMMSCTAALQINIDIGPNEIEAQARWQAAHALGPILAGAFCNSAIVSRMPSGWRSARLANWFALDPGRTRPVGGRDAAESWARYALAAPVMFITSNHRLVPQKSPMTLTQWIAEGHPLGYPDLADIQLHLTTLFPPVRPRGWLEFRMIDALPRKWARAAIAVTHRAITNRSIREAMMRHVETGNITWKDAFLFGNSHPAIASAANLCFKMVTDTLTIESSSDRTRDAVAEYRDRFIVRRRTPADAALEDWVKGRDPLPTRERQAAWS